MTLTLKLSDEQTAQLVQDAKVLGMPVEEIALRGIEDYIRRKKTIRTSMNKIMEENAELYRRLAQ
jgi:predicted transcriptional regulator